MQQEWYDLSQTGKVRNLQRADPIPDPYWETVSPLRSISTLGDTRMIRPDPAHTYAIAGWGKDLCGSGLVLLCRMRCFGHASVVKSLEVAFDNFKDYCKRMSKTTSITEFSFKTLKIESLLGIICPLWFCHILHIHRHAYTQNEIPAS